MYSVLEQKGRSMHDDILLPENLLCGCYEIHAGPPEHSTRDTEIVRATDYGVTQIYKDAFTECSQGQSELHCGQFADCMQLVCARIAMASTENDRLLSSTNDYLVQAGKITLERFLDHCTALFGRTRQVVLKCMRAAKQYEKEKHIRSAHGLGLPVALPLLSSFVYPSGDQLQPHHAHLQAFPYVMVMPAVGRSWREISQKEELGTEEVRWMLHSLALSIQELHSKGIVHGSLCLRHIVRLSERTGDAGTLSSASAAAALIDFTAAAAVGSSVDFDTRDTAAGVTHSSAYLPPEMLLGLDEGSPQQPNQASAAKATDIWAFGAIMYALCAGQTLFHCDRHESLCGTSDVQKLAAWVTDSAPLHDAIHAKLREDPVAAGLLCSLLQPCVDRRVSSMEEALRHPYFASIADKGELVEVQKEAHAGIADVETRDGVTTDKDTEEVHATAQELHAVSDADAMLQQLDASGAISASGDAGVVQALLAAMLQSSDASQSATFMSQSINVCESRVIGQEGGFLRGIQGISVEIPPLAMAPGGSKEVSLEVLEGGGKYAALASVSLIVRITPCNYQFRRPVYVTLPHCLLHPTKANLSVALFDSVYGLRNVLDPNAVQYLPQSIRFPVSFACDVVATFRDPALTRHLSSDCSNAMHCRYGDCNVPISGLRPRRQCRFCDTAFCVGHCTRQLNGAYCCDACDDDSWTVYMQARCEASGVNSDVELSVSPCYKPARAENVLRCSYRENTLRCSVQVNLNEREFTQSTLGAMSISFKVPAVAVVMVSDVRIKDQEPCQWRFYKS